MSGGGPGQCDGCGESTWLLPLHGERGGPLRCFKCAGEWNARHSRRRKAGRIVIKALKLFDEAGGSYADVNKLQLVASGISLPGYEADTLGVEIGDITLELLMDALVLCHPDRHPVERKELATRVTQELLALKPFVFPAPKPELPEPLRTEAGYDSFNEAWRKVYTYPCADCADQTPYFYCNACRAEWEKRYEKEHERDKAKQREWYRARRARRIRPKFCAACKNQFTPNRTDAKFCCAACRQRAHRNRVTDKGRLPENPDKAVTD